MIDMMHAEQRVDVFGFVAKIREQRSQLVQTDVCWKFLLVHHPTVEHVVCFSIISRIDLVRSVRFLSVSVYSHLQMQYSFIYRALLEYYLYGDTELDVSSLEGHLQKLHNTFTTGDRVGLEEEFRVQSVI